MDSPLLLSMAFFFLDHRSC